MLIQLKLLNKSHLLAILFPYRDLVSTISSLLLIYGEARHERKKGEYDLDRLPMHDIHTHTGPDDEIQMAS